MTGHEPVLLEEALTLLDPEPGSTLVDATLGLGGHAEALLERIGPHGRLIGVDRDPIAMDRARQRLERFGASFVPLPGRHEDLDTLLDAAGVGQVDGLLFDLGLSSLQLDDPARGFSFRADGPLDMRMDPSTGRTAAELLGNLSEDELRRALWRYGEERNARAIARAIVRRQLERPIERTLELARLVEAAAGPAARRYRIHPATRTFQALRILVNGEIEELERTVELAVRRLRKDGRIAVIAFHSLEDRAVKRTLRALAKRCVCPPRLPVCGCGRTDLVRLLTTKAIRPRPTEIERNPRARSARLRGAQRL